MCAFYIIPAHLQPPRDNPSRLGNYTKSLHEIKTDGIDLTDWLKVDDKEKLDLLNNINKILFEPNEDNSLF